MTSSETLENLISQNQVVDQALVSLITATVWPGSWSNASFIGSGSIWFSDFAVVNGQLGIPFGQMYAVTETKDGYVRTAYNNTSGVNVVPDTGGTLREPRAWTKELPNYNPENRKIIWLNFDQPLNTPRLELVSAASEQLETAGDTLIVSCPTGFETLEKSAEAYFEACLRMYRNKWRAENAGLDLDRYQLRPEAAYYTAQQELWLELMATTAWDALMDRRIGNRSKRTDQLAREDIQTVSKDMPIPPRDAFEDWMLSNTREHLRFMRFVTAKTFTGKRAEERWSHWMDQYAPATVPTDPTQPSPVKADWYAGATAQGLLSQIRLKGGQSNLATLFNFVYNDGRERLLTGVTYKGANMEDPQLVLQAIFNGLNKNPNAGITQPLRVSVPAVTTKEISALKASSVQQVQQWMRDVLETAEMWYPNFPALIQFYPSASSPPQPSPAPSGNYYVLKNPDGIFMTVLGQSTPAGNGYGYPFGPATFSQCDEWINKQMSLQT